MGFEVGADRMKPSDRIIRGFRRYYTFTSQFLVHFKEKWKFSNIPEKLNKIQSWVLQFQQHSFEMTEFNLAEGNRWHGLMTAPAA